MKTNRVSGPDSNATVCETPINCVEHSKMKGVSTRQFVGFNWLRDLYEKQIQVKSGNVQDEISATSLRACVEDEDLEIFVSLG